MKEIQNMTNKELIAEINDIEYHIENLGVGRYEVMYRELLWREADRREIEVKTKYTL